MAGFKEISSDHIFRLLYVVRNAACCRSLNGYKDNFNQSYWILIYNNFFDITILEWCKIFGTYSEPTHWTTLVKDQNTFRQGLLATLNIKDSEWCSMDNISEIIEIILLRIILKILSLHITQT